MKPLMKPAGKPHPDLLKKALGLCGISAVVLKDYEACVDHILQQLKALSFAETVSLEKRLDEGAASLRSYVFSVGSANTGNVQLSYGGKDDFTMGATLFWSFLPSSVDQVVVGLDALWSCPKWRTLYAYDGDDYSLQNCTMVSGMKNWGLNREQVDFINRYGIVEEIDTRANPGFMLNEDGLFWSVQWLNYWSREAQGRMLTGSLPRLPMEVTMQDLGNGGIRIRLGEKPGHLDDVAFHELQLECKRSLPFRLPFGCPSQK